MSQVRLVHPSNVLLSFTHHTPRTAVFEFDLANDSRFALFEDNLSKELTASGVGHTYHWSKNSGISPSRLHAMYGTERITKWRDARKRIFEGDATLMKVFDNDHVARAGLV